MAEKIPYFDPNYVASRHRYVDELRELAQEGSPKPQEDWDSIYVFSGPEQTLDDPPADAISYNQSEERLAFGMRLAREVTAIRVGKDPEEVTDTDILTQGPRVHSDGTDVQNDDLRTLSDDTFKTRFAFPRQALVVAENSGIRHTGDQFAHFPQEVVSGSRKVVLVSDLYHIPRIRRYLGGSYDAQGIPPERLVFAFSPESRVAVSRGLSEARRLHPYKKGGFLSSD